MAWATLVQARQHWFDAPSDDATLTVYLNAAYDALAAYGYTGAAPVSPFAERFVLANIFHAREIYRAAVTDGSSDVIGVGDFVIRARPLTAAVKALLRPPTGFGWVVG